jgi:SAM domain (Sterile alpha motif).
MMDIGQWLRKLGLERYEPAFRENKIDSEILPKLTVEDLKELGVSLVGDRRRLLDAIDCLRPQFQTAAPDSVPQAAAMLPLETGEVGGERRQVAILFADLCGFTASRLGSMPRTSADWSRGSIPD